MDTMLSTHLDTHLDTHLNSDLDTVELGEHIDRLTSRLDWLDDRELADRLQALERLYRKVEHAMVATVALADRRGVWVEDGHRSVRGWCQATVNWSGGETMHRLRTVKLVADCDVVGLAMSHGTVGVAQVRELARARANRRCGDQLTVVQELLLADAQHLPFEEFRGQVQGWERLADVDGSHRDHDLTHQNRRASLQPVGDGFELRGQGGVAQGATMAEILEAFCDAEFAADVDDARQRLGLGPDDPVTVTDLARTAAQRRWDALHAIFLAAAANPHGPAQPAPTVDIVVDQTTFEAALAAMASRQSLGDVVPPPADPNTRCCQTIDGTPLDPCDAVVAALIGRVRRVVFGSKSCTIDLGVATRLFRGSARMAVWLQDGTRCIWPGCGLPHPQIDHSHPASERGPTNPANGDPLCGRHNRWKTRGYTTWRDHRGRWRLRRPDGTEIKPI